MLNPASFREAIRTVTVSYPVPFLVAVLLAFAIVCFGGCFLAAEVGLRWLLAAIGTISSLGAIGLAVVTPLLRPDLLRSEHHSLLSRAFDLMGDNEIGPGALQHIADALPLLSQGPKTTKPRSDDAMSDEQETGND